MLLPNEEPKPVTAALITDAVAVKEYLTKAGVKSLELAKLPWEKPEEIVESVVKLHGATLASYRNSGLG
jgi:hypothetical protein